jgi:hypothetical protein
MKDEEILAFGDQGTFLKKGSLDPPKTFYKLKNFFEKALQIKLNLINLDHAI